MAKVWPTLSGSMTAALDILTIDDTDTAPTHQELADGIASGALYGFVGGTVRANMVVKKTLGESAHSKYLKGKIGGIV